MNNNNNNNNDNINITTRHYSLSAKEENLKFLPDIFCYSIRFAIGEEQEGRPFSI